MEKVDRRIKKTENSIKQAVIALLATKSLKEITISEVAEKADIQRKTFYRHYDSIQSVINEFEDEILTSVKSEIQQTERFDASEFILILNNQLKKNYDFYRNIFDNENNSFLIIDCRKLLEATIENYFGRKTEIDEHTLHTLNTFLSAGIVNVYAEWFSNGADESVEQLSDEITSIIEPILVKYM